MAKENGSKGKKYLDYRDAWKLNRTALSLTFVLHH